MMLAVLEAGNRIVATVTVVEDADDMGHMIIVALELQPAAQLCERTMVPKATEHESSLTDLAAAKRFAGKLEDDAHQQLE